MKNVASFILLLGLLAYHGAAQQLPRLQGMWQPPTASPRVFDTPEDIHATAAATKEPGSYTAKMWAKLTSRAKDYVHSNADWGATYSGCDLDLYLRSFSFGSSGGYSSETRSDAQIAAAMHPAEGKSAPRGAAIAAADLAMYAALVHAGAAHIAGAPTEEEASALARKILLAWANHGFRLKGDAFRAKPTDFCGATPKDYVLTDVGLQVGRGAIQFIHAQDLLMSLHVLDVNDQRAINPFDVALFNMVRYDANFDAEPQFRKGDRDCALYSNQRAMQLLAMLAISRFLNKPTWMAEILYGGVQEAPPTSISWVELFDHAIYGEHDKPVSCYPNTGKDRASSKPSYQTKNVAPGEIEDRYRNANPEQGIGYPMFTLQDLYLSAVILRNSGYDAFHYRGRHGQSIQMGTDYYACYARNAGFNKVVNAANAHACPNGEEYIGQDVNSVDGNVLFGSEAYPQDSLLHSLLPAAEAQTPDGEVLGLTFGHWPK